jgi:hypothetical protein
MASTVGTQENTPISDDAWNAFWKAQHASVESYFALVADRRSYDAIANHGGESLLLELYGVQSGDEVDQKLKEMRDQKPLDPTNPGTQVVKENGQAIKGATDNCNTVLNEQVKGLQERIKEGKGKPSDWGVKMNDLMDRTIKTVTDNIRAGLDALKERGDKYPVERPLLERAGQLFNTFCIKVSEFVKTATEWLIKSLDFIWEQVEKFGKWVWDKIPAAVKIIISFFVGVS